MVAPNHGAITCPSSGARNSSNSVLKLFRSAASFAAQALALLGRHPTPILILPSLWFLIRYLPFWKDIDATVQLIAGAYDDNILHFPPVYSFLARVPFFVIDSVLKGNAPGIFERQHPSLAAVYGLVLIQHAGLWLALRYFLFSFPARDTARGAITLLLASIASFYAFAHTCGSEAMTPITYFLVFGVGIRALLSRATWRSWVIYAAAVFLAVGSRHINAIVLLWLPGTAILLALWSVLQRRFGVLALSEVAQGPAVSAQSLLAKSEASPSLGRRGEFLRSRSFTALTALICSFLGLGAEKGVSKLLCHQFGIVERSSVGRTMSGRIATWVDQLSTEQKQALLSAAQRFANDPLVKLAIQFQINIGSYDNGTGEALAAALQERGFQGEKLSAEKDRLILQSSLCFYRTFNAGLIKEIVGDFWHGFVPTNDQGIAISAPKATYFSLERIAEIPSDWIGISELPIFVPGKASATLQRATKDFMIRHWRWLPILAWTILFVGLGSWRARRGLLPGTHLFIGLSILSVGVLIYAANCVFIYAMPRYALPLLVTVIAFGTLVSAADGQVRSEK
jgi:hypothetical protein